MTDNLDGPRLKLGRAEYHADQLRDRIDAFRATKPFRLFVEMDPARTERPLKAKLTDPLPDEIPLIFGDAVHNLRASLDLLCRDLAERFAVVELSDDGIAFPFAWSREKFEGQAFQDRLKRFGDDVVPLFLQARPYKGPEGNQSLFLVHQLDIADKHQDLVAVLSSPNSVTLRDTSIRSSGPIRITSRVTTENEIEIIPDLAGMAGRIAADVGITVTIATPQGRREILATLAEMREAVETFHTGVAAVTNGNV